MAKNVAASLICFVLVFVGVTHCSPKDKQSTHAKPIPSLSERIDHIRDSVVQVSVSFSDGTSSSGSGFVVNKDGCVITANHVVNPPGRSAEESKKARINVAVPVPPVSFGRGNTITGGFTVTDAKVVDTDIAHDIAILAAPGIMKRQAVVETPDMEISTKVSPVRLAGVVIKDGDAVFVSGYPLSFPVLITNSGFVASSIPIERDQTNNNLLDTYWLDLQANPGNSGGPVFSLDTGYVIAIQVGVLLTAVKFLDPSDEDVSLQVTGPDGKVAGSRKIGYNSGIAKVVPVKYIQNLLIKNGIPF